MGNLPNTRANLPTVAALMQKQEEENALQQRYQQNTAFQNAYAAQHPELLQVPKIGPKGYMTSELQQRKPGPRPFFQKMPVVGPDGQVQEIPSYSTDGINWTPIAGTGGPKFNPKGTGKETLSDDKLKLLQEYRSTGKVPAGFQTEEEFKNYVGLNRGNQLQDISNTMDLRDLNKESADLKKDLAPFQSLLTKYPDGNIPTAELQTVRRPFRSPFAVLDNAAPLQAALARLAEIEQQKQQIVGGKGKQPAPGAPATPAGNFSDFYQKTFGE
jgi:hypothetical protein